MHFLNTPLGVACLFTIGSVALANIYFHWISDGLVGRLIYMALALTCIAGLFTTNLPLVSATIITLYTGLGVRNLSVRSMRYFRYRRTIHAKKH